MPPPLPQFLRFLENRNRGSSGAQLAVPATMAVAPSALVPEEDADVADEQWFNAGIRALSSQVFVRSFCLRDLFIALDSKKAGVISVDTLVQAMLDNGFPEPGNPATRPRLTGLVTRTLRALADMRLAKRVKAGPATSLLSATQRLGRAAREFSGGVSFTDMVDLLMGRLSPLKLQAMVDEGKDKVRSPLPLIRSLFLHTHSRRPSLILLALLPPLPPSTPQHGEEDKSDAQRVKRVQHVLSNTLRAARADMATFDALYRAMDTDKDGWVSIDEVCAGLDTLGFNTSLSKQTEFRNFVARYCHTQPGYLNPAEFNAFTHLEPPASCTPEALQKAAILCDDERVAARRTAHVALPARVTTEQLVQVLVETVQEAFPQVKAAFKLFDSDCDGRITVPEFFHALNDLGISVTPDQARAVFARFDINDTGSVTMSELTRAIATMGQQIAFTQRHRRPSVAVESGTAAQLDITVSGRTGLDRSAANPGLPRAATATAAASSNAAATAAAAGNVGAATLAVSPAASAAAAAAGANPAPREGYVLTEAGLQDVVKAVKINPNSKARDMFRQIDQGNKNKLNR